MEQAGARGIVSSRPFLMGLLKKAEIDEEIMDDVADACAVNRFTAASLASKKLAISVVADKLFLTDDEAAKLIRVCEEEVRSIGGGEEKEEGKAASEGSNVEESAVAEELEVDTNGKQAAGGGVMRSDAFRLGSDEEFDSQQGDDEDERVSVGENDVAPSKPLQVQVQIRSSDPPQQFEEEVKGPSHDVDELEREVEEEYENRVGESDYAHPVEGDASSDATSPFVATNELQPTSPDANVALGARDAFLAPAGVDSEERSVTNYDVAPDEEVGDSSDVYTPELVQRPAETEYGYNSMPASKSLENGVVSPAMTAQDDFLASDNEGSEGPASSRASTNFNATRQHLHTTTSSTIVPESYEGTPPRVHSFRQAKGEVTPPERPNLPALRLNSQRQPSSKGQALSSSGASVDTTSGLNSTGGRSAARFSGEADPPMNFGQYGSARGSARRRPFVPAHGITPAQAPRREPSFSRQSFDGPSYLRPTVASEARRRAIEASKAAAATRNDGWGKDDYRNRPQSSAFPPSSGYASMRRPLSARPPRRPPSASVLKPTQAFLARQACNARSNATPSPTWRPNSRGGEFGLPPAVVEQPFRGETRRVAVLRRKSATPHNTPPWSPEDPQN